MRTAAISLVEHMGDIVSAEPASRHLKARGLHVTWFSRPVYSELLVSNPNIDEYVPVECLSDWAALPYERMFDEVYDMHFDNRLCHKTGTPVKKRVGDASINLENYLADNRSLTEIFHISAGLPPPSSEPILHLPPGPPPIPSPYILLHCRANEWSRDWSDALFRMLAYDLIAKGHKVAEIGLVPVASRVHGVLDLTGRSTLRSLADAIRHASLFIAIDSGPAHMAKALSVPSLILTGSYRTWKWYDLYGKHPPGFEVYLHGAPLATCGYEIVRLKVFNKLRGA